MARERKRGRSQLPNHTQSTSQIGLRKRTHNRIQNKIAQRALAYDSLSLIDVSVTVHGHSISVDLGLKPIQPPPRLYHGTAKQFVPSILQKGLLKMTRQYVHLSYSVATARSVGMRHGVPVVLEINAEQMARDGIVFYRSENGVWLTDSVSPCYISVLSLLCCYQSLHGERINTVPIDHFRPYCCCS